MLVRSPKPVPKIVCLGSAIRISSFPATFGAPGTATASSPSVSRRCPVESVEAAVSREFSRVWPSLAGSIREPLLDEEGLDNTHKWPICRYLSPLPDSNRGPPPDHGTSHATGGSRWQRLWLIFAPSALRRFAVDCHRFQPRGSIKAPSSVVRVATWRRRVKRGSCGARCFAGSKGRESSRSVLRWVLPSGSESSPARRRGRTCSVVGRLGQRHPLEGGHQWPPPIRPRRRSWTLARRASSPASRPRPM
jgi:hypothetical protein